MHSLKMPDATPGIGIQSDEGIRVQVVAQPISAVEVGDCRSGRRVDDSAPRIQRKTSPIVGGSAVLPGMGGQV